MIFIVSHYKTELYLAKMILAPDKEIEISSTVKAEEKMLNLVYLLCLHGFYEVVNPKKQFQSQIKYSIVLKKKEDKLKSAEKEIQKNNLLKTIKKLGYKIYNEEGMTVHMYPSTMHFLSTYSKEYKSKDVNTTIYLVFQKLELLTKRIKEWKDG